MNEEQLYNVLDDFVKSALANVHTATIAKVTAVGTKTISVKPVINRVVRGESIELPVFTKVPPIFLGGGSSYTSYPIAVGDYALLIFTERCFDRWYSGVDNQKPLEMRMHDYSDGFALVGLKNVLQAVTIPTQTTHIGVMRVGVASPTDFVALAAKVLTELQAIKTYLDTVKVTFDAHFHGSSGGAPPVPGLGTPPTPASVAGQWIKTQ